MKRANRWIHLLGVSCIVLLPLVCFVQSALTDPRTGAGRKLPDAQRMETVEHNYGRLPLAFETNAGQFDSRVRFAARGRNYTVRLSPAEVEFDLETAASRSARLGMRFAGASASTVIAGLDPLPGKSHYFVGNDPGQWRMEVPTYRRVKYKNIYPGTDLYLYGDQGRLEYDFVLEPGADAGRICMFFRGASKIRIANSGDLLVTLQDGELRQVLPTIYQIEGNSRQIVQGRYKLRGGSQVGIELSQYDHSKALVIDPVLQYSTYLGGSQNEAARGIAADNSGNVYIVGYTTSRNLPVTSGALQTTYGGSSSAYHTGDAFVAKINPAGTALVYCTYIGGSGDDIGLGIAVDDTGNAYVTGYTNSPNFPVTKGAFQTSFKGSGGNAWEPGGDAFVTKINPSGSGLVYSTYLGGSLDDRGLAIAADAAGNAYVTGVTLSTDFPVTSGALQTSYKGGGGNPSFMGGPPRFNSGDAFVAKINPAGTALVFSTYFGGSQDDAAGSIVVDAAGNIWIAGVTLSQDFPVTAGAFQTAYHGAGTPGISDPEALAGDGFVARISPSGSSLVWATYIGGSLDDGITAIAVDSSGNVFLTGATNSSDFPTTPGAYQTKYSGNSEGFTNNGVYFGDAFVAKLSSAGNSLVYSTYLGGSRDDCGWSIAVTPSGNAWVAGHTQSSDFPVSADAIQKAYAGGSTTLGQFLGDVFLIEMNPGGDGFVYSTYLGGSNDEASLGMALDGSGNIYLTGNTDSSDFPTTAGAFQSTYGGDENEGFPSGDTFVVKVATASNIVPYSFVNSGADSLTSPGTSALSVGYAQIQPDSGKTTPAGVAIFGLRQNGTLVTEAGVPVSPLVQQGRIYYETAGSVETGLAIANPNNQSATINYFFTNQSGDFGSGTKTLDANTQISGFLDQAPYNGGPCVGCSFTFNSSIPVSAVALRGFNNERKEFLITTLPVADTTSTATDPVIFPDFADGGGMITQVILINPSGVSISGKATFYNQGTGQPMPITVNGQTASSFDYAIVPHGAVKLVTSGSSPTTVAGFVRAVPSPGDKAPTGVAIFSYRPAGITVSEAGVPAVHSATAFRLFAASSVQGSIHSGIAVANLSAAPINVTFELSNLDGSSVGVASNVPVPGSGQISMFLDQIAAFSALSDPFQGVLRVSTASAPGISVVGIRARYNERGDFLITTIPSVDESGAATQGGALFPHFVDGDGSTTQFILFSGLAGQASSGVLKLFQQSGQPFFISLH